LVTRFLDSHSPAEFEFRPESLTAIVGASGLHNIALVLPSLLELVARGHKVGVVEVGGARNTIDPGNPFDFAAARGPESLESLRALLETATRSKEREWAQLLAEASPRVVFGSPFRSEQEWLSDLKPDDPDCTSVLLVPDLQENFPLRDWTPNLTVDPSLSFAELMPAQLVGLKRVSRRGKLAVLGCHCAGPDDLDSWRVLGDIADKTVLVNELGESRQGRVFVELRDHHPGSVGGIPAGCRKTLIDLRFSRWRDASRWSGAAA
jgi:hypothetical protein